MTSKTDPIASGSTVVSLIKVNDDAPRPAVLGLANGIPGPLDNSGKLPTSQVPGVAGSDPSALHQSNNLADLPSAVTARANLSAAGIRSAAAAAANVRYTLRNPQSDLAILTVGDSTSTPLGPANNPWPNQLAALMAVAYPALTWKTALWADSGSPGVAGSYGAPSTVATGSGAFTATIYNLSVSGQETSYPQGANWTAGVAAINADLVVVSHGHNETTTTTELFRSRYIGLMEQLRLACPRADVLCFAQNPHTDGSGSMPQWAIEVNRICTARGYGFVNIFELFLANPSWVAQWMTNSVHPNNTGQGIIAAEVAAILSPVTIADMPRPTPPASFAEVAPSVGVTSADLSTFDGTNAPAGAAKTASLTLSKELTILESPNGYSMKLVAAAASQALTFTVPAKRYAGRWITWAVRKYIPAGTNTGVGRIAIADNGSGGISAASLVSIADGEGQGGWRWDVLTKHISSDATGNITLYVYATDGSVSAGTLYVDRVSLSEGLFPRECAGFKGGTGSTGSTGATGSGERTEAARSAMKIVAQTFDFLAAGQSSGNQSAIPAGELTGGLIHLKAGDVIHGVAFMYNPGSITGLTLCKVGLYDAATSALLASSADQSGTIGSTTGLKNITLSGDYTETAERDVYLAILAVGFSGTFGLWRGLVSSMLAIPIHSGRTAIVKQTGQTDLPATATFAAGNNAQAAYWMAATS